MSDRAAEIAEAFLLTRGWKKRLAQEIREALEEAKGQRTWTTAQLDSIEETLEEARDKLDRVDALCAEARQSQREEDAKIAREHRCPSQTECDDCTLTIADAILAGGEK